MGINLRVLGSGGVTVVVVEGEETLVSMVEQEWKSLKIGGMLSGHGATTTTVLRALVLLTVEGGP